MRILYAGNNLRGIRCLEYLIEQGLDIIGCVAHPIEKEEPGYYESIRKTVTDLNIPLYQPNSINSDDFYSTLRKEIKPDLIVLVGYSQLLKKKVFDFPKHGTINCHASPLPYYRGGAPLNWMLINGEKQGCLSIIKIDTGVDTGDILKQYYFDIKDHFTIKELIDVTLAEYPRLLYETINEIRNGEISKIVQDPSKGSYFTKRFPKDSLISFKEKTAEEVHQLVKALTRPFSGAFTYYNKEKITIFETDLLKTDFFGVPCRIASKSKDGIIVIAKDRGILIKKIKTSSSDIIIPSKYSFKVGSDFDL